MNVLESRCCLFPFSVCLVVGCRHHREEDVHASGRTSYSVVGPGSNVIMACVPKVLISSVIMRIIPSLFARDCHHNNSLLFVAALFSYGRPRQFPVWSKSTRDHNHP